MTASGLVILERISRQVLIVMFGASLKGLLLITCVTDGSLSSLKAMNSKDLLVRKSSAPMAANQ